MAGANAGHIRTSFSATLLTVSEGKTEVVECSSGAGLAQDGWLIHRADVDAPLVLHFDYISHSQDRVHYNISAGPQTPGYSGARLGVSANGFVGLYQVAAVSDFWKVQLVSAEDMPGMFDFILRDHRGHVVKSHVKRFRRGSLWTGSTHLSPWHEVNYLSVETGEPIVFRATMLD